MTQTVNLKLYKKLEGKAFFVADISPEFVVLPIDHNPHVAGALGRLIVHWAAVEGCLMQILGALLNDQSQVGAQVIFEAIVSAMAKIEMLRTLASHTMQDGDLLQQLRALLDRCHDLNSVRNRFAHGIWGTFEGEAQLHLMPGQTRQKKGGIRQPEPIMIEELEAATLRIAQLHADLYQWLLQPRAGT